MSHNTPKIILVIIILALIIIVTHTDKNNIKLEGEKTVVETSEEIGNIKTELDNEAIETDTNESEDEALINEELDEKYNCTAKIKVEEIDKSLLEKISYEFIVDETTSEEASINKQISMKLGDSYSTLKGVTTFRGNTFRDSASYGYIDVNERQLEIVWNQSIGNIDGWTGVGWNGQPSIVEWDEDIKKIMNIKEDKIQKSNLKEVIYGTLDGNIYFIDLDDGKFTRNSIKVPAPIKGSVTVDPRGYPLLYVGQGLDKVGGKAVESGYRIFSLLNQERLYF